MRQISNDRLKTVFISTLGMYIIFYTPISYFWNQQYKDHYASSLSFEIEGMYMKLISGNIHLLIGFIIFLYGDANQKFTLGLPLTLIMGYCLNSPAIFGFVLFIWILLDTAVSFWFVLLNLVSILPLLGSVGYIVYSRYTNPGASEEEYINPN